MSTRGGGWGYRWDAALRRFRWDGVAAVAGGGRLGCARGWDVEVNELGLGEFYNI